MSDSNTYEGLITKNVGGFYTVEASDRLFSCRPRGILRLNGTAPTAGDIATIEVDKAGNAVLTGIRDRKNYFLRPPLANIDLILLVVSTVDPEPNTVVIDKLLAVSERLEISTALVFTKTDIAKSDVLFRLYSGIGFPCFSTSAEVKGGENQAILDFIKGKKVALIGNTGVGKSSLLNTLFPELMLKTGETSKKLGRGRHTTRQTELFKLKNGGYIADTPGFSTVDLFRYCDFAPIEIQRCFPEFTPHIGKCRFADCIHIKETSCAVKTAVESGDISASRYKSYVLLTEEAASKRMG